MKPSLAGGSRYVFCLALCMLGFSCGGSDAPPASEPGPAPVPSTPPARPGNPTPPAGMTPPSGTIDPAPATPPPAPAPTPTPTPTPTPGPAPIPVPMPPAGAPTPGPADAAATPTPIPNPPPAPPPTDPGPVAACKVTAGAEAATSRLAFRAIELVLPGNAGAGKSPGGLTELRFMPGTTSEALVSQKAGRIHHLRIEGDRATVLASYTVAGVFAEDDCGLVSFTYDPGFVQNRIIYAAYCTASNRSKVSRFTLGPTALTGAADVITFSEPQGTQPWHSVGSLGFDPDGSLWMLHGEFTDATNSQSRASNLGKLLRLRPRRDQPGFDPAPGNAFPEDAAASPLVYAMGFRSPWRAYRDSKGRYLVGDVGNTTNEELNLVTQAGQNFGWNGSRSGPCAGAGCAGLVNPLTTYRNGNDDPYEGDDPAAASFEARAGRAIWVGVQYQDCGMDRYRGTMTGVYLFGDWYTGWVRGAVIGDDNRMSTDRTLGVMPGLSAWDQGPDGYLYAARFGAYGTGGHANERIGLFRVELATP